MSLFGSSSSKSFLGGGSSGGSGGGGGGNTIKGVKSAFEFKARETKLRNNLDVEGDIQFSGKLYQGEQDALFDLQNLFKYLTKPAPAFIKNTEIGIERFPVFVSIHWKKGKDYDTSYNFALEDKQLPYIDKIGIDARDTSGSLQNWVNVSENIPATDTSFNFNVNTQLTDNSGNTVTIDQTTNFKLRVYPINSTNTAGEPYNYLVFDNLSFVQGGVPSNPRELEISLIIGSEQKSFKLTFIKPEFNDSEFEQPNEPPIERYKLEYIPLAGDKSNKRFPQVLDTKQVEVLKDATNSTTEITVQDNGMTPVYPGTTYDISLSAKNEENSLFGDVSSIQHTTELPKSSDFKDVDIDNLIFGGFDTKTLRIPGEHTNTSVNYFNINLDNFDKINFIRNELSFFVNYTQLGLDSSYVNITEPPPLVESTLLIKKGATDYSPISKIEYYGYTTTEKTMNGFDGSYQIIQSAPDISFVGIDNIDASKYGNEKPEYQGFGLIGSLSLSFADDIFSSSSEFPPSSDEYSIKYECSGNSIDKTGGQDRFTKEFAFRVDDISGTPTINDFSFDFTSNTIIFNHGIPSIKDTDIDISWNTTNNASKFISKDGISQINTKSTSGLNSLLQNYLSNELQDTYEHQFSNTLFFTEQKNTQTISNAFEVTSFNCINTSNQEFDISVNTDEGKLYCDYNSFTTLGGKISDVKPFGKENIFTWSPTDKYILNGYNNDDIINDNQLIYFDGKFVGPEYYLNGFSPYTDFSVYRPSGKINISYSSKTDTGDNVAGQTVKWLIKRFDNITSTSDNQLKRLKITDNSGTHYDYSKYNQRLFVLQQGTDNTRISGWLDLNTDFKSKDRDFEQDIGVANSSDNTQFFIKLNNDPFNLYVRIGIPISSTQYISNLVIEDA